MLLFTMPKLLTPARLGQGRRLIDVTVLETGLELRGGREIVARTPWPNKHWMVVGRKGNPPTDGLLIDVGDDHDAYTVRTRWEIGEETVAHELRVVVADRRHDVVAAHSTLWSIYGSPTWRWDSVKLPWMQDVGTMRLDAFMPELAHGELETLRGAQDTVSNGMVTYRHETLDAPSVERERYDWIVAQHAHRGPSRVPATPING